MCLCTGARTTRLCGKVDRTEGGWGSVGTEGGTALYSFSGGGVVYMCLCNTSNSAWCNLIWCSTYIYLNFKILFSSLYLPWRRGRSSPGGWRCSRPQGAFGLYHWAVNRQQEKDSFKNTGVSQDCSPKYNHRIRPVEQSKVFVSQRLRRYIQKYEGNPYWQLGHPTKEKGKRSRGKWMTKFRMICLY